MNNEQISNDTLNEKSSTNDTEMKTEFVNFRKKQFETGHVENILHDPQRESKTKKYSEKKKYENEWNRLTATTDVESVMERASHFEDIDPDKFARLKSKLPSSPSPSSQENIIYNNDSHHDTNLLEFDHLRTISNRSSTVDSSPASYLIRKSNFKSIIIDFYFYFISQIRVDQFFISFFHFFNFYNYC